MGSAKTDTGTQSVETTKTIQVVSGVSKTHLSGTHWAKNASEKQSTEKPENACFVYKRCDVRISSKIGHCALIFSNNFFF